MGPSNRNHLWSKTWLRRILICHCLAGIFALSFWLSSKTRSILAATPPLVVAEEYLSFGETWENPCMPWNLPIHNTTDAPIEIERFATSCSCVKIEPLSLTVPALATTEIHLTLDLRTAHSQLDLAAKDFQVFVMPQVKTGPPLGRGWVIRGKVRPPFAAEPEVVDFEDSLVRGEVFQPRFATIWSAMDLAEVSALPDSPFITARLTPDSLQARRFRLEVRAQANTPPGPFNHSVRLTGLTPDRQKVCRNITIRGQVVEEVEWAPDFLGFGAAGLGTRLTATVNLHSRRGQNFAIQEIHPQDPAVRSIEPLAKDQGGNCTFVVTLVVEKVGHQQSTILFTVKTAKGILHLPLRVTYYGILAQPPRTARGPRPLFDFPQLGKIGGPSYACLDQ